MQSNNTKLSVVLASYLLCAPVFANNWEPIAAESLIKLPVNLIEKRIAQDFRLSPVSNQLLEIDNALNAKSQQISALNELLEQAQANEMIDERVDLVQLKSSFLDLMQEGQALRQQQLTDKMEVYQAVLAKMYESDTKHQDSKTYKLNVNHKAAKQRMQHVLSKVDAKLLSSGQHSESPYAKEFSENLSKIEQLKQAIAEHQANLAPVVDGREVSSQEYIRQLLMKSSSEQSLLDQEGLMLSYMSKLVALDAQALEFVISESDEISANGTVSATSPRHSVNLFL